MWKTTAEPGLAFDGTSDGADLSSVVFVRGFSPKSATDKMDAAMGLRQIDNIITGGEIFLTTY